VDASPTRPYLARRSREVVAVGGWEHTKAARAARGAAPTPLDKRGMVGKSAGNDATAYLDSPDEAPDSRL